MAQPLVEKRLVVRHRSALNQKPNILLQITNYVSKSSPYSPLGILRQAYSLSRMGEGETMPRNERDYELRIRNYELKKAGVKESSVA
ncbi:hypothetical protein [Nostoc sp.]|uniref:hypothetical protein n=1 Tax=Nostoc sp. TaxID=1180 RepID=UPI002FF4EFD4